MPLDLHDTIAALASAPGPSARGILRVSGDDVRDILEQIFQPDHPQRWRTCRGAAAHDGSFPLWTDRPPVAVTVYLWPNRRSYTGEPLAEIHAPGSPPLLEAILARLYAHGARPARAGEFTLRAFLAGRMDLVQAEAVLGVIEADDHVELEAALRQLAGGLSGRLAGVRRDLIDLLADLEAGLDFVEEDIEFLSRDDLLRRLRGARDALAELKRQSEARMHTNVRRQVVLAGLPNAGKSTLFNALAGGEIALVSDVQGTTRDYLRADLDWQGVAIELIDTAGWESGAADIAAQAQSLRSEQVQRADLILWCTAVNLAEPLRPVDAELIAQLRGQGRPVLHVVTKADLDLSRDENRETSAGDDIVAVSVPSQSGLEDLRAAAISELSVARRGERQLLGTTAARCRDSLAAAVAALERAAEAADLGEELVAVEVRLALDRLGRILGSVYTDDILDRIFSRFCIGK
ncbi:MAG: tRNA modification GTPase [Planctomycetaceae bacterium]